MTHLLYIYCITFHFVDESNVVNSHSDQFAAQFHRQQASKSSSNTSQQQPQQQHQNSPTPIITTPVLLAIVGLLALTTGYSLILE
jgi:hypothetical protein